MHTVFAAQQDSGVLDARKLTSPSVSELELARRSWQSMQTRERTRCSFTSQPKDWLASFNGILKPARDWPSATVPTHVQSVLAWQWMLVAGEATYAGASWGSRLIGKHQLLTIPPSSYELN